ncbi:chemotaxis protein CheW [Hyphobacterium sp. SN044]|uniref:chemotaxis protein CheW n=1 Tax=Hyphobacterium sp. SN044 TaxID=2912575 RepID=UPI001F3199D3|nr:chemotaxis protein CheW [Hyphobacterium sp. SN044]MCF8880096.1 chemotaxis protein CheW [Hyphobacterium sp. SN044]
MNEANQTVTGGKELISFRIGEQEFCVDIMAVREIRGWTPATPLPQSPSYVRGIINLRGAVLPVVDLAARLGLGAADPSDRHVIIVARIGERWVGLLVDAVSDILAASEEAIQPAPDVACDTVRKFVRGVLPVEGRMISLISLDHLLPEKEAEAA